MCVSEESPWFHLRKVYRVLPDETADQINWLRVVDEFHEDYLYPAEKFALVDLPKGAERFVPDVSPPI